MTDSGKRVSVTITPQGLVRDIVIGGHSVGRFIPADAVALHMGSNDLPQLSVVLVPDEVIMKEADRG